MLTVSDSEIDALEKKVWEKFEPVAYPLIIEAQKAMHLLQDKLRDHHPLSFMESLDVASLTIDILEKTHLNPKAGGYGALLHDVGKSKISREILDKTYTRAEFTDEDFREMRKHSLEGYKICREKGFLFTAYVVLNIHRFQENPYPGDEEMPEYPKNFSRGTKLNVLSYSRHVALADDYLAFHRPNNMHGKEPLTKENLRKQFRKKNSDQEYFIDNLYELKIFT